MKELFKKTWRGWKKISHFIGRVNSYVILTLFYFLVIGPVAVVRQIIRFLARKPLPERSYWMTKKEGESNFKQRF